VRLLIARFLDAAAHGAALETGRAFLFPEGGQCIKHSEVWLSAGAGKVQAAAENAPMASPRARRGIGLTGRMPAHRRGKDGKAPP
jgi:hypothetical protein